MLNAVLTDSIRHAVHEEIFRRGARRENDMAFQTMP